MHPFSGVVVACMRIYLRVYRARETQVYNGSMRCLWGCLRFATLHQRSATPLCSWSFTRNRNFLAKITSKGNNRSRQRVALDNCQSASPHIIHKISLIISKLVRQCRGRRRFHLTLYQIEFNPLPPLLTLFQLI